MLFRSAAAAKGAASGSRLKKHPCVPSRHSTANAHPSGRRRRARAHAQGDALTTSTSTAQPLGRKFEVRLRLGAALDDDNHEPELFVLDDGWFGSRRDDTRGLGDWQVSTEVWPDGLGPLVDHVKGLGLEFGIWFEPEMVNLDSDLVRAHPDWVLGPAAGPTPPSRNQHVLDLANPEIGRAHV